MVAAAAACLAQVSLGSLPIKRKNYLHVSSIVLLKMQSVLLSLC